MEVQHVIVWPGNPCAKLNMRYAVTTSLGLERFPFCLFDWWTKVGLESLSHVTFIFHFFLSPLWMSNKNKMIKWKIIAGVRTYFDLMGYWSHILAAATNGCSILLVCCLIRITHQLLTAVKLPKKDGCPLWPQLDSVFYYFYLRGVNCLKVFYSTAVKW